MEIHLPLLLSSLCRIKHFVTSTWKKYFRINIYSLGLTITSCCQAQIERDFICACRIIARTQHMPTAALQYIWSTAADWLCEPTVTQFMFSIWVKLCISFAVWGISIDLWYLWYLVLHLTISFCLPLVAVSSEVEGESREESGCTHSYPWLHRVKLKTEVSWCGSGSHFCHYSHLSFHYETSMSHFPIESSPQHGKAVSNHSALPEPQSSQ